MSHFSLTDAVIIDISYDACRFNCLKINLSLTMKSFDVSRYWGWAALVAWGGALIMFNMLRYDPYGMDENTAFSLLMTWTVIDRLPNPIVFQGILPDLRALIFAPVSLYWPGSLVALKVFMGLMLFLAATLLYRWIKRDGDTETALIASGLLLIAPISLMQINAVGAGPILLLGFALGLWIDKRQRDSGRQLGGWYFTQLLMTVAMVSIHPAGLAFPLALAWHWWQNPISNAHKKQMLIGMAIATIVILIIRFGWPSLDWGVNPLLVLGDVIMGHIPGDPRPKEWSDGVIAAGLVLAVFIFGRHAVLNTLLGRMLGLAIIIGAVAADYGWAFLCMAFVLYLGTPLLIKLNSKMGQHSFLGQRGLVTIVLFITTTAFMVGDRGYRGSVINATLDPHDEIIKALATETQTFEDEFNTISQWPARTMLALKRPVLPMPPDVESHEKLLEIIGKVAYIIFDPFDPDNQVTRDHLANLSGVTETLIQQPNGVIVKFNEHAPKE